MTNRAIRYIDDLGLHDAKITKLEMDFPLSQILIRVSTSSVNFGMVFKSVSTFNFEGSPDFKNQEIVLNHEFFEGKTFRMYTTSCINYEIRFEELEVEVYAEPRNENIIVGS